MANDVLMTRIKFYITLSKYLKKIKIKHYKQNSIVILKNMKMDIPFKIC